MSKGVRGRFHGCDQVCIAPAHAKKSGFSRAKTKCIPSSDVNRTHPYKITRQTSIAQQLQGEITHLGTQGSIYLHSPTCLAHLERCFVRSCLTCCCHLGREQVSHSCTGICQGHRDVSDTRTAEIAPDTYV